MSDGLRLIAKAIEEGSPAILLRTPRERFIEAEATALDFILDHHREYRVLPSVETVRTSCGVRLPTAPEPLQYYIDAVRNRRAYNVFREEFPTLRESASRVDGDPVAALFNAYRRVRAASAEEASSGDAGAALDRALERNFRIRNGLQDCIFTGWPTFDRWSGGYQPGDLITWVARMGMGKTYILLYQAVTVQALGGTVAFFTTEMADYQIMNRYAAIRLGVDPRLLRDGQISTATQRRWEEMRAGEDMQRFSVYGVGLDPSISRVRAIIEETRPSAVFIDGVYFLQPTDSNKYASKSEKASTVVRELKGTAQHYDTPIIVTTQHNREAGKGGKDGSLETIGGTDSFGQDSSIVVQIMDGDTSQSRKLRVEKEREGGSKGESITINFTFAPTNFTEMSEDDEFTDMTGGSAGGAPSTRWTA